MPCIHSGSTSASWTGVSLRAARLKPITSRASWRNLVCTRCDSASAVCFIGPHRPSCHIETDRSTHSATAALVRRSVSTTSKSSTRRPSPPEDRTPPLRTAFATVRTASTGRSSPNSHGRVSPVGSSAAPVRRSSWSPGPCGGDLLEDPAQGGLPQPPDRPRRHPQPVVGVGDEPLPFQLLLQLAQGVQVRGRVGTEVALEGLHVDAVEGGPGAGLPELLLERLEVGEVGDRLHRGAVAERLIALHLCRPPVEPGTERAQVVGELGHLRGEVGVGQRLAHQLGELFALLGPQRRHHPVGGRLPPGEGVDELVDVLAAARGRSRRAGP